MNFNNFTIKSQEAIQKAVELTKASGSQAIEPVHLLKGSRCSLTVPSPPNRRCRAVSPI